MEKQFLERSEFPLAVDHRISVTVWQDYDALDALMGAKGYVCPEPWKDEAFPLDSLRVGASNSQLHSGWIATMGDGGLHSVKDMIELLNRKVAKLKEQKKCFLVGFCRTGNFTVGYSIYVKGERDEWN